MYTYGMKIGFASSFDVREGYFFSEKDIFEDRGSRYAATIAYAAGKEDLLRVLTKLKEDEYFSVADHNSWAMIVVRNGARYEFSNDDGETGAGKEILREMQKADITNAVVVVTRHFGGIKLERDRYAHIQTASRHALAVAREDHR